MHILRRGLSFRRRTWIVASVTVLCASVAGFGPGAVELAAGAKATCGTQGNYFAGGYTTFQTSLFGSRATIEKSDPDLCSSAGGSPSASSAWSMVTAADKDHPNIGQWAQSGYAKFGLDEPRGHPGLHVWAEYTRECRPCAGDEFIDVYFAAPTGAETYTNVLRSSDGHIHMYADGVQLTETPYNPANVWDSAWSAQFSGETFHPGTDVPGVASNPVKFSLIQRYESNGDINFIQNLTYLVTSGTRYHRDAYNPSTGGIGMRIWADPL